MSQNNGSEFPFLNSKISVQGWIETRTGLHIGGSDVGLAIGGADNIVVRSPKDNRPYIPGSSLKGKMRSILERAGYARGFKLIPKNESFEAKPCDCGLVACPVCMVFGVSADQKSGYKPGEKWSGSGRLMIRDGLLTDESAQEMDQWHNLDMPYTEVKTEVAIDRLTCAANPRNFERVPAGARFSLDLVLNVHQGDDENKHFSTLLDGLELLATDYLGGHGTRGYGAIQIEIQSIRKLDITDLKDKADLDSKTLWNSYLMPGITLPWKRPLEA